ncbi:MAG: flagellar motor switch protein FliM [Alicyclobacillus sp.]|nr:flagellar motor switch protein FliM [Alicyclobacillus sp.]
MSDILSQSEIDALLSALTSGELKAEDIRQEERGPRVRNYDFRRAMRFSKDHIRIIHRIHEHFARLLTTHLSGILRSVVQVQVESVDQLPYEEFIRSIPTLTVMYLLEFAPLEGKVVVEINPQIVFAVIDRLMGGVVMGPYRERELTEIEAAVLRRAFGPMPGFFADVWRSVIEVEPRFVSTESNPQFLQLATPNETVLVATLSVKVGSVTGFIHVCIPHVTLEPVVPKLTPQYFMDAGKSRRGRQSDAEDLARQLAEVQVDATVVLGETELTMMDLLQVQVGDVIPLRTPIASPVRVVVEGVSTFAACVGKVRDRYAVKILGHWQGGDGYGGTRKVVTGGNRRPVEQGSGGA